MTILTAKSDLRGATVSSDMLFTVSPWLSPLGLLVGGCVSKSIPPMSRA